MEYLAQELGALQPAGLYACVVLFLGHFFGVSHSVSYSSDDFVISLQAASPRILRAAEILCDMKRSTEDWSAQGYSNGAIKWPKSPSETAMKARKPSSPFGTAESSSGSRNSDAARSGNNQPSKKIIVDRKNDSARLNNPGKSSIRWPAPIEDSASPVRSERGLILDTRQPHGNGGRLPSQVSSQARLEEYENDQRLRKATLTSSLGSAGDWNRERNRRM
jgi:hypothetical protein